MYALSSLLCNPKGLERLIILLINTQHALPTSFIYNVNENKHVLLIIITHTASVTRMVTPSSFITSLERGFQLASDLFGLDDATPAYRTIGMHLISLQ